jgi:hypothetical protein
MSDWRGMNPEGAMVLDIPLPAGNASFNASRRSRSVNCRPSMINMNTTEAAIMDA